MNLRMIKFVLMLDKPAYVLIVEEIKYQKKLYKITWAELTRKWKIYASVSFRRGRLIAYTGSILFIPDLTVEEM